MRWWGWGDPGPPAGAAARTRSSFLRETVGLAARPRPPVALEHVRLRAVALSRADARASCARSSAPSGVRDDHAERVAARRRQGLPGSRAAARRASPRGRPTRSCYPADHEQLRARARAVRASLARGGAVRRRHERGRRRRAAARRARRRCSRSTCGRMGAVLGARPRVADGHRAGRHAGAGARALPGARAGSRSATSRSPSSTSRWAAARPRARRGRPRAATARSSRWCSACAWPRRRATSSCRPLPASAAGPGLRQLLVGSEGTLGVISELALRVRPAPRERVYEGVFFEDFAAGVRGAARARAASTRCPTWRGCPTSRRRACRSRWPGSGGVKGRARARAIWRCAAIGDGLPGDPRLRGRRRGGRRAARARARAGARAAAGCAVGRSPGRGVAEGRASRRPTCATSCSRTGDGGDARDGHAVVEPAGAAPRGRARRSPRRSRACGTPGLVMCHVSHLYETGASLYFTFLAAPARGR